MPDTAGARLVASTLNRFVGMLHAARSTAMIWIPHAGNPESAYRIASKYGLQMTFGTTLLTLRKFEDLVNSGQLRYYISDEARTHTAWILRECREHNARKVANLLFAHYASDKTDPPLSNQAIRGLVKSGGWGTEEAFVEWSGPIVEKLGLIRDDIMARYGITTLEEGDETAVY
jgi:hypothetical protein